VSLHWWWFVVAMFEIVYRNRAYTSMAWNVAEYLALFAIVLMHEFGHALACRQTGGQADHIVLWPFGGVAFVNPPQRPGAQLWAIAAGPLVNAALVPLLSALSWARLDFGWGLGSVDVGRFLHNVALINFGLLVFNLMPVYPLDGGQILRSVLWFFVGRARSLQIASIIGFIGVAVLAVAALMRMDLWLFVLVLFVGQQCLIGYRHAQGLQALAKLPRHADFRCPSCSEAPPGGPLWLCGACGNRFDPFSTRAICPHCQTPLPAIRCAHCGTAHPFAAWEIAPRHGGSGPIIEV
jgi:Zn-dependent protease